jgi:hypothetical protein
MEFEFNWLKTLIKLLNIKINIIAIRLKNFAKITRGIIFCQVINRIKFNFDILKTIFTNHIWNGTEAILINIVIVRIIFEVFSLTKKRNLFFIVKINEIIINKEAIVWIIKNFLINSWFSFSFLTFIR